MPKQKKIIVKIVSSVQSCVVVTEFLVWTAQRQYQYTVLYHTSARESAV